MNPITRRIRKATEETQDALTDYFSRVARRLSNIYDRFEAIETQASTAIEQLDKALPVLNSQLVSYPDALRVIDELHRYVVESGEELSQINEELKKAQSQVKILSELSQKGKHDIANVQMVAQEGIIFVRNDPDTIDRIFKDVDMGTAQEVLEKLPKAYWQKWQAVFKAVQDKRVSFDS